MIAVEELYEDVKASRQPVIVFNGELDRIRSGAWGIGKDGVRKAAT